jgi:hypothetical protein
VITRDVRTIPVHGIKTALVGNNEPMEIAKPLPCGNHPPNPATTSFPMTDSTMAKFPRLQVGQVWRTRKGDTCTILSVSRDDEFCVLTNLYGKHWHNLNGWSLLGSGNHEDDLVSLLVPWLAAGQSWKRADGKDVVLEEWTCTEQGKTLFVADGFFYEGNGEPLQDGSHLRLVSLISDAAPASPEPTPKSSPIVISVPSSDVSTTNSSAPHIPPAIVNGDEPFYVVVVNNLDGEKLVWETPIPEATTLTAALEQRLKLAQQYPVSYIAECRIIPLLTQQP